MKRACFFCLFFCLISTFVFSQSSASSDEVAARARALDEFRALPLSFEANHGQTDSRVKFFSRTAEFTLFLASDEAVLALSGAPEGSPQGLKPTSFENSNGTSGTRALSKTSQNGVFQRPARSRAFPVGDGSGSRSSGGVLRMKLFGANATARVSGMEELEGKINYFIGKDPSKWRTNVPTYAKVRYEGIYSGVDLVYYGNQRKLEYDFIVAPGRNPRRIAFDIDGAQRIRRDSSGELVFKVGAGEIRWHRPVVYQEKDGARELVAARYVVAPGNRVRFAVGKYDARRTLYIDPVIYSTYLEGGLHSDRNVHYNGGQADAVAVDSGGNAYVTGFLPYIIFPGTCGSPERCMVYSYTFIAKINATGTALIYSTFLGGAEASDGGGNGIAVDSAGNAYVAGQTDSSDFPVTPGAFQTACGQGCDYRGNGFVTKLNAAGSNLVYSTYLGGSREDGAAGIAIDSVGDAYLVGRARSPDFPVTPGAFQTACGNPNSCVSAFVTEMNPTGTALVYSTYLGGSGSDTGTGIALDSAGNAYVTGFTGAGFPTTPGAFQTTFGGNGNAFVTELNAAGSALVYSTYLGGSEGEAGDVGNAIAVDGSGDAYVTGITNSTNFPVTGGAFQTSCGDCGDGFNTGSAFVSMLNPTGTALVYSTYLGGSGEADGTGVAVDSAGNAYVVGLAGEGFPTTPGAFQTTCCGAFVTKINSAGSFLYYSTYLDYGTGMGIALDSANNTYVVGVAGNGFPTTKGVLQKECDCGNRNSAHEDAFATKINPLAGTSTSLTSAPNPSTHGEAVTFTASVSWSEGAAPDGESVSFMSGKTVLGTGMLSGGSVRFSTSALGVGTHKITAVYGGDSTFAGSTSAAVEQVVEK
jgi:hypothetical protein